MSIRAAEFISQCNSIPEAFHKLATKCPELVVYSQSESEGNDLLSAKPRTWRSTNYAEVQRYVNAISAFLLRVGVRKGQSVAILAGTRPEWLWSDLAILSCGGITVSVYQSLPAEEIGYILFDSESRIIFAENSEQVEKLLKLHNSSHSFPATEDRPEITTSLQFDQIIAFEQVDKHPLVTQLSTILNDLSAPTPEYVGKLTRNDIASLVYTSGTTGPPKGVIQTHGNHLANVRQAYDSELVTESSSISMILPLAHSFARLMGYLGFLTPAQLRFPAIIDRLSSKLIPQSMTKDLKEGSASVNPVVPRLLEKMRDGVTSKTRGKSLSAKILRLTLWAAEELYNSTKLKHSPPLPALIAFKLTYSIREKIKRQLFGPNFAFCLSGGAKLPITVSEFFSSLGMPVIEGYGLTETCVATNVGRLKNNKLGTVGPVLAKDIEMKIAEDGEILFRGPNIALGYHKRPTATRQAWDEQNWFHTGDLGSVDSDGYLSIVGRKKDLIVTSGGKNIAPHHIEVEIKKCSLVSQAVLIGDGRKYCVALVSLNVSEARRLASSKGATAAKTSEDLHKVEPVFEAIWAHISKVNSELPSYETVKRLYIVPEDFSVENGQMTPTFKIKRNVVEQVYKAQIDSLY